MFIKNTYKILSILGLFFFIISCGSIKKINDPKKIFIKLDSLQASRRVINFKLDRASNWIDAKYPSGSLYYYLNLDDKKLRKNFSRTSIIAFNDEVKKEKIGLVNIDDFLRYKLEVYYKEWYDDFKYILLEGKHKKYGKLYILKYKEFISEYEYENAVFLLFYKNFGYTIQYTNHQKYFHKYLLDVEKMINSIKIIEK